MEFNSVGKLVVVIFPCNICLNQNYYLENQKKKISTEYHNKLNIIERIFLNIIYDPVLNYDTQVWDRRTNEQIKQMFENGSVVQCIKRGSHGVRVYIYHATICAKFPYT